MDRYIYYIWLNFIEMSTDKKVRLIEYFGSARRVFEASEDELLEAKLLSDRQIKLLLDKNLKKAEKEYKKAEKYGVEFVCLEDDIYPKNLMNIYDPPILLYTKGNKNLLKKELCFCIVGTRYATPYGLDEGMKIASALAECGMVIVSGLAIGGDSATHQGALKVKGDTIGVAACGINREYPAGNGNLRRKIAENGLIISEFPFDYPVRAKNFHIRNRILSGLSLGTAVIEAPKGSGTLITANHAKEQNRDVFALPGNITSRMSKGANELINDGATVILGAETILAEYLVRYPHLFEIDEYIEEYKKKNEEIDEIEISEIKEELENAEKDDKKIIKKLLKSGDKNFEEIISETGMETSKLNVLLTTMQIEGIIYEKMGRIFSLK